MNTQFSIDLQISDTINLRALHRVYDPELDDVRAILADFCDAAEGRAQFIVRGFGQDRWPVDVRTDLLVFLEQLPTALRAVKAGLATKIDFYEQGIERFIELVPAGGSYQATCVSYSRWQPNPAVEELDRAALEGMLLDVQNQAVRLMESVTPELAKHAWVRAWLDGTWSRS